MEIRLGVIGASAGVGLACVQQGLEAGHRVISLSRNISNLPKHDRLTVQQGSATNVDDLRALIAQSDSIIVALGTGMDRKPTTLYTDFAKTLLQLESEIGNKPIQILTGFGAGDSAAYQSWLAKTLFNLLLKAVYENKTAMEKMIEASALNWTLIRPGMLTNGPAAEVLAQWPYRQGMRVGSISRKSVAQFMVDQATQSRYRHQKPALSTKSR